MDSLIGMLVASTLILGQLEVEAFRAAERAAYPEYAVQDPAAVDAAINTALSALAVEGSA